MSSPSPDRPIDTLALNAFLRERLAPYKVPSRLVVARAVACQRHRQAAESQTEGHGTPRWRAASHEAGGHAGPAGPARPGIDRGRGCLGQPAQGGRSPLAVPGAHGFRGPRLSGQPARDGDPGDAGLPVARRAAGGSRRRDPVRRLRGRRAATRALRPARRAGRRPVRFRLRRGRRIGAAEQRRLADICRAGGMRLLGPNSIGVASFDTGAVLSFASIYADCGPEDGPVAIVSQSGAFGVSVYALLREAGVGVRCVAATGNEADLDTADFVHALANRPGVRLILLYLENGSATRHACARRCRRRGSTAFRSLPCVQGGRPTDAAPHACTPAPTAPAFPLSMPCSPTAAAVRWPTWPSCWAACRATCVGRRAVGTGRQPTAGDREQLRRVVRHRRRRSSARRPSVGRTGHAEP